MADRVTIDFEKNMITWDTDNQKGTEICPGLIKRKPDVIKALGYETVDITPVINLFNEFINEKITKDELLHRFDNFTDAEK